MDKSKKFLLIPLEISLATKSRVYKTSARLLLTGLILIAIAMFSCGAKSARAQDSPSALYVPLMGISSVPDPLSLPKGPGNVTYNYAVKNFLVEVPLTNIKVVDDKCSPVKFTGGDDNGDGKLDYNETWRYACTTKLNETTESIATATGVANNLTATHEAHTTVVVGGGNPAPLVNIVNVTKVAYPLNLSALGGDITFTYRVNNPGVIPLSDVSVTDDKCSAMSGKLGDTNGNNLLDVNEVWVYTCTAHLTQTTTSTVKVTATANGFLAVGSATLTVTVAPSLNSPSSNLFDVGINPLTGSSNLKIIVWAVLSGILAALIIFFVVIRKRKVVKNNEEKDNI